MDFISVFLLCLAVSCDGFFAGFAYGVRRVHIPLTSLLIICLSSSFSVYLSMRAGSLMAALFSARVATFIGGLMLVAVGTLIIRQSQCPKQASTTSAEKNASGISMLSCVLREPPLADFDCSGVLSGREAVILGVALAMDAFGAGFGAAMMGFAPAFTALAVGATKFCLLSVALITGRRLSKTIGGEWAAMVSGVFLIVVGVAHLM